MKLKKEISAGGIVYKRINLKSSILDPASTVHGPESKVWLISQHSQHKHWGFPKGIIGDNIKNESMEEAAFREVEEEGGIKAKIVNHNPIEIHYNYRLKEYLVKKIVYYFLMESISGDPKNHDWEVSEAKFVSGEEVRKLVTYETEKEAFEKAFLLQSD